MSGPRDFKFRQDLDKTQNTFNDDPKKNRSHQIRRDNDSVNTPKVNFEQIDTNLIDFINTVIKPKVIESDKLIPVTTIYAHPEKWNSIQQHGYLRDDKQNLLRPLIAIKRESTQPRPDLPKNKVLSGGDNVITVQKRFTKKNRYDQFSILNDQIPINEYYTVEVPDYVDINYTMIVWCDLVSQVNSISESMIYWLGKAWGTTYKFMTKLDSMNFET